MRLRIFIALGLCLAGMLVPGALWAASLYLSPSTSSRTVGIQFNVTVGVNSGGVAINAAQATVSFPTNILEVTGVSKSGTFSLWPIEPSYSNARGTVSFAGGAPNPGYNGTAGSLITITFRGKATGTASVTLGSASVLANDGHGTNVLTSRGSGTYTITEVVAPPPKNLPRAPTITSSTHLDSSRWYPNAAPSFSWNREDEVTSFSFALDAVSDTTPDTIADTNEISYSYTGIGDGAWYFHVRAMNKDGWGPAGHYRVQIDTVSPLPFVVELLDGPRTTVTSPRIRFATTDATSGVARYNLSVDGGSAVNLDPESPMPYQLTDLNEGRHTVSVVCYDQAGNSSTANTSFTIISSTAPPPVVIEPPKKETTPEKISKQIDKVTKQIEKILPAPIRNVTKKVGETVQQIRQNETVSNTVSKVVQPVASTGVIVAVTGLATTASGTQVFNLFYLLFRFGYFWLVPVSLGKKRKSWGVVFDSITGKPIPRAIVRLFSREFNKLRESQVTDRDGRFGFLIDEGIYYISVTCPGYAFPSRIMRTAAISQYEHIYRGDTLSIDKMTAGALSVNIPVDPNMRMISTGRLNWMRILNTLGYIIEKINVPLLIAGTILSWITVILQPKLSNYLILAFYALLISFRYFVTRRFGRSWGMVRDRDTGLPLEQAIVRIFNATSGSIVWTRITNQRGQFNGLLVPGSYYLVIVRPGYEAFHSMPVAVTRRRGYIHFTAELRPLQARAELKTGIGDLEIKLQDMPIVMARETPPTIPPMPSAPVPPSVPPPTERREVSSTPVTPVRRKRPRKDA